jgi:hypothetical protein
MNKEHWVWGGHAGHFICGDRCAFKLNTTVGKGKQKYIVSTVGEMMDIHNLGNGKYEQIGYDRLYETMVFKAKIRKPLSLCCPYEAIVEEGELDFAGYNKVEDATGGHYKLCKKWDK